MRKRVECDETLNTSNQVKNPLKNKIEPRKSVSKIMF